MANTDLKPQIIENRALATPVDTAELLQEMPPVQVISPQQPVTGVTSQPIEKDKTPLGRAINQQIEAGDVGFDGQTEPSEGSTWAATLSLKSKNGGIPL